jgi:hypothetical protein
VIGLSPRYGPHPQVPIFTSRLLPAKKCPAASIGGKTPGLVLVERDRGAAGEVFAASGLALDLEGEAVLGQNYFDEKYIGNDLVRENNVRATTG